MLPRSPPSRGKVADAFSSSEKPASGDAVGLAVGVEVGESQAAIDLDIVVEYGVSIADLGRSIQRNVKQAVERMTGLDVVEVNINVDDLWMPGSDDQDDAPSRVS